MTDQEIVQEMRNRMKFHEQEVERYRKALAVFIGPAHTNGTKPKREGEQRPDPTKSAQGQPGKPGATRARVAAYFAAHPTASNKEAGKACGLTEMAASYHMAKLRKAAR